MTEAATYRTKRAFLSKCGRRVVGSAYGQALNSGVQIINFLASGPLVLIGWEGAGAESVKFTLLLDRHRSLSAAAGATFTYLGALVSFSNMISKRTASGRRRFQE